MEKFILFTGTTYLKFDSKELCKKFLETIFSPHAYIKFYNHDENKDVVIKVIVPDRMIKKFETIVKEFHMMWYSNRTTFIPGKLPHQNFSMIYEFCITGVTEDAY